MLTITFSPFPFIKTNRLLLRDVQLSDTSAILHLQSDPVTLTFLDKKALKSTTESELLIRKIIDDLLLCNGITWALTLKEDPKKLIGTISFWRIVKEHYRAEIGYMLMSEYFRKGYMKEAIAPVVQYGFRDMNLHSIEANIHPGNTASSSLLTSQGFKKEGYHRENFFFEGKFKDTAVFSLLEKDIIQPGK